MWPFLLALDRALVVQPSLQSRDVNRLRKYVKYIFISFVVIFVFSNYVLVKDIDTTSTTAADVGGKRHKGPRRDIIDTTDDYEKMLDLDETMDKMFLHKRQPLLSNTRCSYVGDNNNNGTKITLFFYQDDRYEKDDRGTDEAIEDYVLYSHNNVLEIDNNVLPVTDQMVTINALYEDRVNTLGTLAMLYNPKQSLKKQLDFGAKLAKCKLLIVGHPHDYQQFQTSLDSTSEMNRDIVIEGLPYYYNTVMNRLNKDTDNQRMQEKHLVVFLDTSIVSKYQLTTTYTKPANLYKTITIDQFHCSPLSNILVGYSPALINNNYFTWFNSIVLQQLFAISLGRVLFIPELTNFNIFLDFNNCKDLDLGNLEVINSIDKIHESESQVLKLKEGFETEISEYLNGVWDLTILMKENRKFLEHMIDKQIELYEGRIDEKVDKKKCITIVHRLNEEEVEFAEYVSSLIAHYELTKNREYIFVVSNDPIKGYERDVNLQALAEKAYQSEMMAVPVNKINFNSSTTAIEYFSTVIPLSRCELIIGDLSSDLGQMIVSLSQSKFINSPNIFFNTEIATKQSISSSDCEEEALFCPIS
ncbi:hypothetical protein DFA_04866 [Cavenderia fasciculata]|uniref:Uncharacterized protein n=1 Tax=Cavenderia fasciculata TaxID=261658 RepID=F4PM33_CACFS|nr:uncharacterized protein DFA_04866 [Cavenderia fasciculata]EGG22736.1 hypothetical protein DFA_04866 [Cavenderia fasciculata]|eukprot:XP_004360587.1 hypothetical protein DFA_04866 [Cavenderia fasciculata]